MEYETVSNADIYSFEDNDDIGYVPETAYSYDGQYEYNDFTDEVLYDDNDPYVGDIPERSFSWDYGMTDMGGIEQQFMPELQAGTTHRDEFTWKDPIAQRLRVQDREYTVSDVPFYSETTNLAHFGPKMPLPSMNYKPVSTYSAPEVPFYSTTTHQTEFVPKQMTREHLVKREQTGGGMPRDIKFDGTTTNRIDYVAKEVKRPKMTRFAPVVGTESGVKMESDTTHKLEFPAKTTTRPHRIRHVANLGPMSDDVMQKNTAHKDHFPAISAPRVKSKRIPANLVSNGNFESSTEQRDQFIPLSVERTKSKKLAGNLRNEGEFQGTTTHKSHFLFPTQPRTRPTRQRDHDFSGDGKTASSTEFSSQFLPNSAHICPAARAINARGTTSRLVNGHWMIREKKKESGERKEEAISRK